MSTFDNGWICRECWSANRDKDARCYRCHSDRPAYVAARLAETAKSAAPEPAKPLEIPEPAAPAPEPMPPTPAAATPVVPEPVVAASAPDPVDPERDPRTTGYCITCGNSLLDGARFCTQCGTAASAPAEPAAAEAAEPAKPRRELNPGKVVGDFVQMVRARYTGFVTAHDVAWELAMSGLALVFVLAGFGAERLADPIGSWLATLTLAITVIFVLEYGTRLAAATDRRTHAIGHAVDLVALLPWVRLVRALRLFVFLPRVPAFARAYAAVLRLRAALAAQAAVVRSTQAWLIATWVAVAAVTVFFLYGYADALALDGLRRVVATLLLVLALGAFSAITSAVTLWVLRHRASAEAGAPASGPRSQPSSHERPASTPHPGYPRS